MTQKVQSRRIACKHDQKNLFVSEYARECRLAFLVCQSLSYVLYKTSY